MPPRTLRLRDKPFPSRIMVSRALLFHPLAGVGFDLRKWALLYLLVLEKKSITSRTNYDVRS
jgi:hypothetical protein